MTNDEGGTILRNMKDEYVNGGMLSTAEVRGDIGTQQTYWSTDMKWQPKGKERLQKERMKVITLK